MSYAELVFGKPEILSGLQSCNHTFWQFLPKNLSTKYRRREPGKWKALRFQAVFLLNTLLSFSLTPEEKEHILEEEYGISMKMSEEDFIARMREERENEKTI